jgi:pyroglutamyl-peptidase
MDDRSGAAEGVDGDVAADDAREDATVLLTGYEPFGEHEANPTGEMARDLDGAAVAGARVVGRELPVVFGEAAGRVRELVAAHDPVAVVATGLAAGRATLCVERVGVNVRDVRDTPDNDGATPVDEPVVPDGPAAYLATLPLRRTVDAVREAGVPARVSNTAGTHLCNDLLYATRHHLETTDRDVPAGVLHVPLAHAQVAARGSREPSLGYATARAGVRTALRVAVEEARGGTPTRPRS